VLGVSNEEATGYFREARDTVAELNRFCVEKAHRRLRDRDSDGWLGNRAEVRSRQMTSPQDDAGRRRSGFVTQVARRKGDHRVRSPSSQHNGPP
jgi:hypothetical protein